MYVVRYDEHNNTSYMGVDQAFVSGLQFAKVFTTFDEFYRWIVFNVGTATVDRDKYRGTYYLIRVEMGALREMAKIS